MNLNDDNDDELKTPPSELILEESGMMSVNYFDKRSEEDDLNLPCSGS